MNNFNKRAFILLAIIWLVFFSMSVSVLAAVNETEQVNKAYNWLSSSLRDKWQNISVEDNAFALLALSHDDALALQGKDALVAKSNSSECWPASGCRTKDTALATLALSKICIDTTNSQEWLMLKNATPTDLIWYLQVDTAEKGNCTVSYDNKEYKFSVGEDKKISNAAGSCLSLGFNSYWFRIASSCYQKTFTISCDKDFAATFVYQQQTGSAYYISSDTKKESASGAADLRISAICIKEGASCSYEATLLAALALQQNVDINLFLPYLIAYADKNEKYLPEAYLLKFTGIQDYANQLLDMQKAIGYWLAPSSANSKYYDTALALNALADFSSDKIDRAKTWLLNEQVKTGANAGSWQGSKKDTSFILYTLWPEEASCVSGEAAGGNVSCENVGNTCVPVSDCDGGNVDESHQCTGLEVCCKQKPQLKTCSDQFGIICSYDQDCSGLTVPASDTSNCCTGRCTEKNVIQPTNTCDEVGYSCRPNICNDGEEETTDYSCSITGDVCCKSAVSGGEGGEGGGKKTKWWLIILLVLILGVLIFFLRGKLRRGGVRKRRPTTPAEGPPLLTRPPVRPLPPPMVLPRGAVRPAFTPRTSLKKSETDKELDETLKKLEEIGK